jgi:cytochrome c5
LITDEKDRRCLSFRRGLAFARRSRTAVLLAVALATLVGVALFAPSWFLLPLGIVDVASVPLVRWCKPRVSPNAYLALFFSLSHYVRIAASLLVTCILLIIVSHFWKPWSHGSRGRWIGVPVWIFASIAHVFVGVIAVLFLYEEGLVHLARNRSVFVQHCNRCHSINRPMDYFQPSVGWQKDLMNMKAKSQSGITDQSAAEILQYLVSVRSYTTADLVHGRCSTCHRAPAKAAVNDSRARIRRAVDRLRALDPRFCDAGEVDDIAEYLSGVETAAPARDAELRERFETFCETCHFLNVVQTPLRHGDWKDVVLRMQRKAPTRITEQEALELVPFLATEAADPAAFARRYPHSGLSSPWKRP